jgi:hypothetical protein
MSDEDHNNVCVDYGYSLIEIICTFLYYIKLLFVHLYTYIYNTVQNANDHPDNWSKWSFIFSLFLKTERTLSSSKLNIFEL